ncbi:MAG: glutamate synthase-related protein, partial [Prochlorotrichaceae cyanobacterium]
DVDGDGLSPSFSHLKGLVNGDTANSAIKQVASGRFGVTPEYLMSADQIEIKVAQGAKPGEGGQLPGKKVSPYIAFLRSSKAGVPLISPPPHHDIYSIEDLAQLIFDLHQINPTAKVSVKLVSEVGIGTIAAGVAKANADVIQISGHDGGTGASPLSSIKHAGSPWELGLTEVHRTLLDNQLRDRVLLRVDGGLKTGWDIVMAALMGAEEFGFGSIAMIAEGCIMARVCHTNNCPVGVATQQETLRKRFTGIPGHVVNFFVFVAEEVRQVLAKLGYRNLSEIVGRADLLTTRNVTLTKTSHLHLDCLTELPDTRSDRSWLEHVAVHSNGPVLDDEFIADSEIRDAVENHGQVVKTYPIVNTDRSVGARLAGAIAKRHGNKGFQGQITLHFQGSAGQSFGAFTLPGL